MTDLLHSKNFIGRLAADSGFYQINLLMRDFRFGVTGKSTTVAQKGNILEAPFHTMPVASLSFNTYIKKKKKDSDTDLLAVFMQFGREQSSAELLIADKKLDELLLRGSGIFDNVQIAGKTGGFVVIRVAMTLNDYQHSEDAISRLMSL